MKQTEFLPNVQFKPGNAAHIKFWKDYWLSNTHLMVDFPNLFNIALDKNSSIAQNRTKSYWDVHLRRAVQDWEMGSLVELLATIESFNSNEDAPDSMN